ILGAKVSVPTVDSKAGLEEEVELTIPAGSQPGTVLTLEGKGVPRIGNSIARGDHQLTLVVEIPTRISAEERDLLMRLAELHGERINKRDGFLGGLLRGFAQMPGNREREEE
ncbi:MAG: DnaJ C-terminal domain-containing protein, partial [Cyanobacteriota bacterium]